MGCLVFKNRLNESPYKDLFSDTRWDDIRTSIIRACCRLRHVPFQSYLDTWWALSRLSSFRLKLSVSVLGDGSSSDKRRCMWCVWYVCSLSAGISALPAMHKLVTVMESKLTNWDSIDELPVRIAVPDYLVSADGGE